MGPRGVIPLRLGGGTPNRHRIGPWWSSPRGHEKCEGCAEVGAGAPCGRCGLRCSSLWGHESCEGCPDMVG
eukprot:7297434-Pyramimonas_sp.AAC.1